MDASLLNQVNNLVDSQIGNESFINKNNPNQFNNLLLKIFELEYWGARELISVFD